MFCYSPPHRRYWWLTLPTAAVSATRSKFVQIIFNDLSTLQLKLSHQVVFVKWRSRLWMEPLILTWRWMYPWTCQPSRRLDSRIPAWVWEVRAGNVRLCETQPGAFDRYVTEHEASRYQKRKFYFLQIPLRLLPTPHWQTSSRRLTLSKTFSVHPLNAVSYASVTPVTSEGRFNFSCAFR